MDSDRERRRSSQAILLVDVEATERTPLRGTGPRRSSELRSALPVPGVSEGGNDDDDDDAPAREASAALMADATGALTPEMQRKMPRPWFGYLMAVGCLAGFITSLVVGQGIAPVDQNPMIGPPAAALASCGAKVTANIWAGEYWRLVSPMWLHAGVVHLLTNMNMLYRMGFPFERGIGSLRFATLYLLSGVVSMVYSAVFNPGQITVGASGALFGVMGAMLGELCQNCHLLTARERCCGFFMLIFSIALNLAVGLLPFVDNFAHASGCVSGMLLAMVVVLHRDRRGGLKFRQVWCAAFAALFWLLFVFTGVLLLVFKANALQFCPWCAYVSCVPTPLWSCDAGSATSDSLNATRALTAVSYSAATTAAASTPWLQLSSVVPS